MLFALPIFAAMAWWAGRGKPPCRAPTGWASSAWVSAATTYPASSTSLGLQYVTASLERLILYLNPTLVLLLGWLLHRKPFTRAQLAGMAISYAGVLMVFGQEFGLEGEATALGGDAGLHQRRHLRRYLVYSGQLVRRLGSLRLVGLATWSPACAASRSSCCCVRSTSRWRCAPQVVWLSVLNATLCTAVPVLLVMMAIERIGPALSAQTGMVGPMSTIAMGA